MDFKFFRIGIPKGTTWKEVKRQILLSIEEEKRKKTIASIPEVMSADPPSRKPSAPTNAGPMVYGSTADQGSHSTISAGDDEES